MIGGVSESDVCDWANTVTDVQQDNKRHVTSNTIFLIEMAKKFFTSNLFLSQTEDTVNGIETTELSENKNKDNSTCKQKFTGFSVTDCSFRLQI